MLHIFIYTYLRFVARAIFDPKIRYNGMNVFLEC